MGIRIGVDTGGTFTDFIVASERGIEVSKVLSTPHRPEEAIITGLERIADSRAITVPELLADVDLFMHGTTIATNTVIQRNGPKIGLIGTKGFRDVLELRDGYKKDRYNVHMKPLEPFIPRYLRLGVDERITYAGDVERPLDEADVREALATFKAEGVEAIAVSLLWSMVNPEHERAVRELIAQELPDVYTSVSSEILPALREYPRTCATALSAYVGPVLGQYLGRVRDYLRENGYRYELLIMQVTGGAAAVSAVDERPVLAIGSGPAAGPAAGREVGGRIGDDNVMIVDMGGTSFEVSLITHGEFTMTSDAQIADMPIGVPAVEIESIGAGGGSIAWIDNGGMLRVGPQSAGATPGPACYGLGGDLPTVTDANLVLGYLDPSNLLGGRIRLDRERAVAAIRTIAEPLGLTVPEAAAAVYNIVNSNMVGAMRTVSVMQGVDPRNYTMINGGGAGGMHAAKLAQDLGMTRVVSPAVAGGLCAFGMLAADVRQSTLTTSPTDSERFDAAQVNAIYAAMEEKAIASMEKQGFPRERVSFQRSMDAKYPSQTHHLMVSIPVQEYAADGGSVLAELFHRAHEQLYTWSMAEMTVDLIGWHLTAIGHLDPLPEATAPVVTADHADPHRGTRSALFDPAVGYVDTSVLDGAALQSGARVSGPAVVELPTTTVVLFPQHELEVRPSGDFLITTGL